MARSNLLKNKGLYNQYDGTTDDDFHSFLYNDISPSDEVQSLDSIRSEIRKLYRTNSLFNGIINVMCDRVIGSGLELQSTINTSLLGKNVKNIHEIENQIEHLFNIFSKSKVDITDRFNLGDIQRQIYTNYLMMGEVFLLINYKNNSHRDGAIKLQVIDPELCPLDDGIEIDKKTGRIKKYHFKKNYESDEKISYSPYTTFKGVPIPNVIHFAFTPRHELYRGIPKLAPIINQVKHMNEYLKEEVNYARISNHLTYILKDNNKSISDENKKRIEKNMKINLTKNNMTFLDKDTELNAIQPPQKGDNFKEYIKTLNNNIFFNLLPQEVLFSQYNSNYSAARGAVMDSRQKITITRNQFTDTIMNPLYKIFLMDLMTKNKIPSDGFFSDESKRMAWLSCDWVGENVGHIDPTKEMKVIIDGINARLLSRDTGIKTFYPKKDVQIVDSEIAKEKPISKENTPKDVKDVPPSSQKNEKK